MTRFNLKVSKNYSFCNIVIVSLFVCPSLSLSIVVKSLPVLLLSAEKNRLESSPNGCRIHLRYSLASILNEHRFTLG